MSDWPDLDLTRPLAFYDERLLPDDERRPIHVVGRTRSGDILIESQYKAPEGKWWDTPARYKPNGAAGQGGGRICNVPRRDSGFYALDQRGTPMPERGLTVLSMIWDDYPSAKYALEIIREDGIPVESCIHPRP